MNNTLYIQPDDTNMCEKLYLYILYRLEKGENFKDIILNTFEEMEDLKSYTVCQTIIATKLILK